MKNSPMEHWSVVLSLWWSLQQCQYDRCMELANTVNTSSHVYIHSLKVLDKKPLFRFKSLHLIPTGLKLCKRLVLVLG